jgi:recombinational DNA repair protein RecT
MTSLVYRQGKTNIHNLLKELNNLAAKMNFTLEEEENNKLNFLDITINEDWDDLSSEIYRKPTATDTIIPNYSCHPGKHKAAAIRYFHNRLRTYDLAPESQQKEKNTV